MKKAVELEDLSFQKDGLIVVHYEDGTEGRAFIDLSPVDKEYLSEDTAKRAITRLLKNKFGKRVKFEATLENAINGLALKMLRAYRGAEPEEREVIRASVALQDDERAEARREEWLFQ